MTAGGGGGLYATTGLQFPGPIAGGPSMIMPDGGAGLSAGYDPQWSDTRTVSSDRGPWEQYALPPLPAGYVLDAQPEHGPWEQYAHQSAALPPLPEGYVLDAQPEHGPWTQYAQPSTAQSQQSSPSDALPTIDPISLSAAAKQAGPALFQGAIVDPALGLRQLAGHAASWVARHTVGGTLADQAEQSAQGVDTAVNKNEADYQAAQRAAGVPADSTDIARLAGAVLSPINYAGGAGAAGLAESVPTALGRILARGAGTGAAMAAAEPVQGSSDYWADKGNQLAWGAGTGALAEPAAVTLGRFIQGVQDPQKRLLLDKDVPLTPGQLFGTVTPGKPLGGFFKRAEDMAVSVPILGDRIAEAQDKAALGFNRATLNEVLAPIHQELPANMPLGRDALDHVSQAVSDQFDNALTHLQGQLDHGLNRDLADITTRARQDLPPDQFASFERIRDNYIIGRFQAHTLPGGFIGLLPGEELKGVDSTLGQQARGLAKDPNHFNRVLGQRVEDLQDAFREMISRVNAPSAWSSGAEHVEALNNANQAYARWVRVRDAAAQANNGVYSPAQFAQSVVRNAGTKNQAARGDALMQDMADAGKAVLPQSVPNSGTTDRRNLTELALALLGGHAAGVGPGVIAGGLAGVGAYTAPGQAMIRGIAAGSPETRQALAQLLAQTPVTRGAVALQNQQGAQP